MIKQAISDTDVPAPSPDSGAAVGSAELLERICRSARWTFENARGSHDWEHTLRVHALCRRLGPRQGADMLVLEAAAYLHDIGRADQDDSRGVLCHAALGADKARSILASIPIDNTRKDNIVHCVRAHRFRDSHAPSTLEARVLFDADKLDAIGAVGVARAYLFAGELGACLHNPHLPPEACPAYSRDDTGYREYVVKLSRIKARMLTAEGKRLAEERHAFMAAFFERFLEEYDGRR
jgi:uncharacterized protein